MHPSSKRSRHAVLVLGIVTMLAVVAVAGPLARRADAHVVNIGQFVDPLPVPRLRHTDFPRPRDRRTDLQDRDEPVQAEDGP